MFFIINGVNKKVDPVGRVVIPIDIRNKLHLHQDDIINIKLVNNSIVMEKESILNNNSLLINNLLNIIQSEEMKFFVSDREQFINIDCLLNDYLMQFIKYNKSYCSSKLESIILGNSKYEGYIYINSICIDSNILGIIILISKINNDILNKSYISLIKKLIENMNLLC